MVKLIQCVRKRPEVTLPEFRRRWLEYGRLIQSCAARAGVVGYVLNTTLAIEQNLALALARGTSEPFDGVVEIRFENAPAALAWLQGPDGRSFLQELRTFQESFLDLEHSAFFFAAEEPV